MHFTYDSALDDKSLYQGDVLEKTEELSALLVDKYPLFIGEEYTHFQVITQSCDLVRRGGVCSARYITLAAVKSFDTVLLNEIERQTKGRTIKLKEALLCSDKHKPRLSEFLKSLTNNNAKEHFYLKAEPEHGLPQDSCTFLHLSLVIERKHYEICLRAKRLQLDNVFQSKLGWMVGNLYSRVGTPDYCPTAIQDSKEYNQLIETILERFILWVPPLFFTELRSIGTEGLSPDQAFEQAKRSAIARAEAKLMNLVEVIRNTEGVTIESVDALKDKLRERSNIRELIGYPDT